MLSELTLPKRMQRGLIFGALIVTALLAFEIFNYSTTDFALSDVLGDLKFLGIRWATILSVAFCGIDFAGIARLFTPEQGSDEPAEVWYLFGAWMLAALMNAMLTWWGVSIAILNHQTLGNAVVARETLLKVVPIFVAIMVWLIRVLIIGTISVAGDRLFSQAEIKTAKRVRRSRSRSTGRSTARPRMRPISAAPARRANGGMRAAGTTNSSSYRPAPKPTNSDSDYVSQEPTYHPVSFSGSLNNRNRDDRQTRF
jgi:hypothetical protein